MFGAKLLKFVLFFMHQPYLVGVVNGCRDGRASLVCQEGVTWAVRCWSSWSKQQAKNERGKPSVTVMARWEAKSWGYAKSPFSILPSGPGHQLEIGWISTDIGGGGITLLREHQTGSLWKGLGMDKYWMLSQHAEKCRQGCPFFPPLGGSEGHEADVCPCPQIKRPRNAKMWKTTSTQSWKGDATSLAAGLSRDCAAPAVHQVPAQRAAFSSETFQGKPLCWPKAGTTEITHHWITRSQTPQPSQTNLEIFPCFGISVWFPIHSWTNKMTTLRMESPNSNIQTLKTKKFGNFFFLNIGQWLLSCNRFIFYLQVRFFSHSTLVATLSSVSFRCIT